MNLQLTLPTPSRARPLTTTFLIALLLILLTPLTVTAECVAPRVCASPAEVNAAADALCRRARTAEARLNDEVTPSLTACETQRDHCAGQLASCETARALLVKQREEERRPTLPAWLFATWDAAAIVTAGATGWSVGSGQARELTVGLAVGAVLIGVTRVVAEWVL